MDLVEAARHYPCIKSAWIESAAPHDCDHFIAMCDRSRRLAVQRVLRPLADVVTVAIPEELRALRPPDPPGYSPAWAHGARLAPLTT